jgi:hypothetical protein
MLRQTVSMLPRKKNLRVLCLLLATAFGVSSLVSAPSQAITAYTPPVSVQAITPKLVTQSSSSAGTTFQLAVPATIKPFSVVGLTWVGTLPSDTTFKARVRESGKWSTWHELHFSDDHGVDIDSLEGNESRSGTDPLMTALADSIEVIMTNSSGTSPNDWKLELIGSPETTQDRALLADVRGLSLPYTGPPAVTPAGVIVARPNIVSRAQWGANETWRDPVPNMGTKIVAGFVHHTASTNNYTPEQAPAQMRALYAYYTKSLKYADMAYNFLVDQYGTVYEGRNACTFGDVKPCDGPTLPVIGAHTAGLNPNTFAISAIGNYDTKAPVNPGALTESIASLMAWKMAPYGLNPKANASMVSSDKSGRSKFSNGVTAVTPVISGHRDVGKTVCPGRHLYPYLDQIRDRAAEILAPKISNVSVEPKFVNQDATGNVNVKATIPAKANWTVEVLNETDGHVVNSITGTQVKTGPIKFAWNKRDQTGETLPTGRYLVSIKATVGQSVLPSSSTPITLAMPPKLSDKVTIKRTSPTKSRVYWTAEATEISPVTSNEFRISADGKKTWSEWRKSKITQFLTSKWRRGQTYYVEFQSTNSIGVSNVVQKKLVVPKYSPPKPEAVTNVTMVASEVNKVTATWTPVPSDYESLGFFTRVSINGGKWTSWEKTPNLVTSRVIATKPGDRIRIQILEKNFSGSSPVVVGRFTAS